MRHGAFYARRQGQTVAPCLMEVKFALNADISKVHEQIQNYYKLVKENVAGIASDLENNFRQRLELGLYEQAEDRLAAMKTLHLSRELGDFQFIVILVDYNPFSSYLNLKKLEDVPFSKQIKVFSSGFAMWQQNFNTLAFETPV